ncbi:hypothetical protein CGRA01v4_11257 [Colletotrichum graminicola]|nr:hypothetical protein CGRA01v4_11257 [Colletotrichum graminicola]
MHHPARQGMVQCCTRRGAGRCHGTTHGELWTKTPSTRLFPPLLHGGSTDMYPDVASWSLGRSIANGQ